MFSRKIFVLGDSRTGTMSLHKYFLDLGVRSVHYYVKEAEVREPIHKYKESNWPLVKQFIDSRQFLAFSDYPTRVFYRELLDSYSDAYFILTTRDSVDRWAKSMCAYFDSTNINIDYLKEYYICWNEDIRLLFSRPGIQFLELCIDEGSATNTLKLANFLGVTPSIILGHFNRSPQM